jgi:hypothetical protein
MRRTCPLILALALALALVPPAGAASKRTCSVKGSKTVVSNRYARVYTVPARGLDEVAKLYGCARSVGRRVLLDVHTDDQYVASEEFSEVGLNGRMVVWKHVSSDFSCKADCPPSYDPVVESVGVRDLRARRNHALAGNPRPGTLLVTRKGTPAWLQGDAPAIEVHAGPNVLDTGAIDSLSLQANVLSWTNAGAPKSATLR